MKIKIAVVLIFALGIVTTGQAKDKAKPAAEKKPQECKANDVMCNYIVAVRHLLADYQTAIRAQIDATQKGYSATAQAAEQGRRDEVESELRFERNNRSEMLADDFIHGSKPIWHWKEYLLDYAAQDFQANREHLELESTDGTRFLTGIQNLQVEFSKVQALDKLLADLNQKQSILDELKELGAYAAQTKTEFDTAVCSGLKKDIAAKQSAKTATTTAIDDLKALPDSPDRNKKLQQKNDESKALSDAITQLQKERTAKACKD